MLEQISEWLQQFLAVFSLQGWVIEALVVIAFILAVFFIEKIIYAKLYPRLQKSRNLYDDALLYALHKPLVYFIWIQGLIILTLVLSALAEEQSVLMDMLRPAQELAIILFIIWFCLRFITGVENKLVERQDPKKKQLDKTTIMALGKVARITVIAITGLITLQTLGIGVSGLVAFGGVSGAAVAFASKDLLANFFGGVIVYFDRPFKVGDWIRSPDRQIEGTVEHIGWRVTRIRTFDKRPLYVPNSLFTIIAIENPSRMSNRRIKTNIGLRYDDAKLIPAVLSDIENMLRSHPEIDTQQTLIVNLVAFAPSSLDFMLYTFTKTTNWVKFQEIQQDIFMKILEIIDSHGAQVAFPTTTLHVPDGIDTHINSQQEN